MKKKSDNSTRYIIYKLLLDFFETNKSFQNILNNYFDRNINIHHDDKRLILNITKGIFRNLYLLDYNIFNYSLIKKKKVDLKTLILLYIGSYQIIFLRSIPNYASVNTTVELSKKINKNSSKYINAVLRKICNAELKISKEKYNAIEYLSLYYSYPQWLVAKLLDIYNIEVLTKIFKANLQIPNIWIRINILKKSIFEITTILTDGNILYEQHKYLKEFLKIDKLDKKGLIKNLVAQGIIIIQNPSSGFVSKLVQPKKGEKILDTCCAPGGKASFIAQQESNFTLICNDINENRLTRTKNNFNIQNINNVKFLCTNILEYAPKFKFDKILVDVPCSSTGTIRKNPDIKWRLTPCNIEELSALQYNILKYVSKFLKQNGEIIYSTCSLLNEENEHNINRFLKNNSNFKISNIKNDVPNKFINKLGGLTILPDKDYEGMFSVKLIRFN